MGEVSYLEDDRQIPVRDGTSITIRVHRPRSPPKDGCPIFVVYHGGGFTLGGLDDEARMCRAFTALGGIAVNVDYRLAPEHPFPVPIQDAYDALKWVCPIGAVSIAPADGLDCSTLRRIGRQCSEGIPGRRHIRWCELHIHCVTSSSRRQALSTTERGIPVYTALYGQGVSARKVQRRVSQPRTGPGYSGTE